MSATAERSPIEQAAIPAMIGVGALVAVQSEINGRLAGALGSGVRAGAAAATISFGSGLALLLVLVVAQRGQRARTRVLRNAVREARLPRWQLLGGLGGASLVVSQGLAVGAIGVALFTVAMVAGQTSSGLLVDRAGLSPSGAHPITTGRAVGASLTLGAVLLGVSGRIGGTDAVSAGILALALLPLAAGSATAWQQAVNGRVAAVGGSLVAALVNFTVGFSALLLVLVLSVLVVPGELEGLPTSWWLYLGGPVGVLFITLSARLVTVHGVLVLGLCTVAGLVLGSVLIDALGPDSHLGPLTVLGAVLTLGGVGVVALTSAGTGPRTRVRPRDAQSDDDAAGGRSPTAGVTPVSHDETIR